MDNPLVMHKLWKFESHYYHILIEGASVYVEYEKLVCGFPLLLKIGSSESNAHWREIAPLGKERNYLMVELSDLRKIVARSMYVDLAEFCAALEREVQAMLEPKALESPSAPRLSHRTAALLWKTLQDAEGLWGGENEERLLTLLEEYVCFPYTSEDDVEIALSLGIQIIKQPPGSDRISKYLIEYFLGKEG
jgi:hypothetical protein